MKVKLTIIESKCRGNYHQAGDEFIVEDICPPICHELWQCIYPSVYALLNGGSLDLENIKAKEFSLRCPDQGRVMITGKLVEE